jgi:predicted transport protein
VRHYGSSCQNSAVSISDAAAIGGFARGPSEAVLASIRAGPPLLGVRFIASEYSTGPVHGGRIDTLGLDEDGAPVVIEYKRAVNQNVINQGLFYLDWLMDHRKDFEWLVLEKLGSQVAKAVDWSAARLLCIAGDFTRHDEHAVNQIQRQIELLRYRKFGDQLLMIELVHAPKIAETTPGSGPLAATTTGGGNSKPEASDPYASQRIGYRLTNAPQGIRDIYEALASFLVGLGDDVQVKELKYYFAFKCIKNFACVEVFPQAKAVTAYLRLNPTTVDVEPGFTRDVRKIGHYGTGDLEVTMRTMDDFAKAQPLLQRAYEGG